MEDIELFVEEASRESSRRVGSRDLVAHAAANRTYFAELWSIRKQLLPIERRVIGQIPRKNISNHNLCFSLISSISNSRIRLKTRRNNDNDTFPRLPSRISISIFWPAGVQETAAPSAINIHFPVAALFKRGRRTKDLRRWTSVFAEVDAVLDAAVPLSDSLIFTLHDPTGPVTK